MRIWLRVGVVFWVAIAAGAVHAQLGSLPEVVATRIEPDESAPTGLAATTVTLPVGLQPPRRGTALPDTRWSCRAWQRPGTERVEVECMGPSRIGAHISADPAAGGSMLVFDGDTIWRVAVSRRAF